MKLKPIIEAKAKERQKLSEGRGQKGTQKSAGVKGESREEIAKLAGVSHDTIEKAAVIQKKATPEQLERARKGGTGNSVNAIYGEIDHPNFGGAVFSLISGKSTATFCDGIGAMSFYEK